MPHHEWKKEWCSELTPLVPSLVPFLARLTTEAGIQVYIALDQSFFICSIACFKSSGRTATSTY
jgi:hypothetical protein